MCRWQNDTEHQRSLQAHASWICASGSACVSGREFWFTLQCFFFFLFIVLNFVFMWQEELIISFPLNLSKVKRYHQIRTILLTTNQIALILFFFVRVIVVKGGAKGLIIVYFSFFYFFFRYFFLCRCNH